MAKLRSAGLESRMARSKVNHARVTPPAGPGAATARVGCGARAAIMLLLCMPPIVASAQVQPALTVDIERSLRFGQFAILGGGSRSLGVDGLVTDQGLLSVGRDGPQTARFTIEYRRKPGTTGAGAVIVQVVVNAPSRLASRTLRGRIVKFDVGGHGAVRPGEPFEVTLSDCAAARCAQSFDLGATLEVEGEGDGSALAIPLSITARTISEQ